MGGRLVMEMLGQDHISILSLREISPGKLHLKIEDTIQQSISEVTVDLVDFVELLDTLISRYSK